MKKTREINDFYKMQNSNKDNKNTKAKKIIQKKSKHEFKKIMCFATLLLILVVLVLRSKLFNIKNITVAKNSKISTQDIINLSELQIGQNMFKFNKYKVIEKIKQNTYIESVKIHRKLNCNLEIVVEERNSTYQIQINEQYGYINNQGYLLEISPEKLNLTVITGLSQYDIDVGARLDIVDLNKLNDINQIINIATTKGLNEKINLIDISNSEDYIIHMESEKKIIHFGSLDDINNKIDWIEYNLTESAGVEGELFLQNLQNNKKPYFREKVSV